MFFCRANFIRPEVVNIFTDASILTLNNGKEAGCYGAIVLNQAVVIDSDYRICTDSTSNNSEIKAIRLGVELAIRCRARFNYPIIINLFSDSQISVLGIRERIFNWKAKKNGLVGYGNNVIKNQSVFIEIMNIIINNNLEINFYHQKGHVVDTYESLNNAIHVFRSSNYVRDDIEPAFIKYISNMNNVVDRESRKCLYRIKDWDFEKGDAFIFSPHNHEEKLKQYNQLQDSHYYL